MIKLVFTWQDKPGMTAEECDAHYRAVHMDLARRAFDGAEGFRALVYNRVKRHAVNDHNDPQPIDRPSDIDAFLELFYESRELLEEAFARPQMRALFEDHVNFMATDIPANVRIYEVDEVVFYGSRPAG